MLSPLSVPYNIYTFNRSFTRTLTTSEIQVTLKENIKDEYLVFNFQDQLQPSDPTPSQHNNTSSPRFTAAAARS